MAVVTLEAAGGQAERKRGIALPSVTVHRPGFAPATLGLIGTVVIGAGIAGAVAAVELLPRLVAIVAIAAGGYVVGRAGVAPPPDDDDLARRDTLLRARERALIEREAAVDGALIRLALRADARPAQGAVAETDDADELEPVPPADEHREPRSRRPGQLRPIPDALDDDGVAPDPADDWHS